MIYKSAGNDAEDHKARKNEAYSANGFFAHINTSV